MVPATCRSKCRWAAILTRWGTCPNVSLDALTKEERFVYDKLRANTWAPRVRLEQERLEWVAALAALRHSLEGNRDGQSDPLREPGESGGAAAERFVTLPGYE